jgi:ribosomal protein S18 acetylase RimI-like enzyme
MYHKEFYAFNGQIPVKAVVRNYKREDFAELIDIQRESFPPPFPSELWWNEEQLTNHVTLFPEGALCVEIDGRLVGSMTGLLVKFDPDHADHTWEEITDRGYIRNHDPNGDTLYVVDICVRPGYRAYGLGKWLMQSMYEVVVRKNLTRLLGGGRMPGYGQVADRMTPEQYVDEVLKGVRRDPVITFLLRCGRTPLKIVANYLEDEESRNHAVLMEWKNPFVCR